MKQKSNLFYFLFLFVSFWPSFPFVGQLIICNRTLNLPDRENDMYNKVIFATKNKGKAREIAFLLKDTGASVLTLEEAGLDPEIREDGTTFKENALLKAKSCGPIPDAVILADDSGLVIDALNGEPGIYSARYLGEDTPHEEKMKDILRRLEGVPDNERSARFVCAMAALLPDGTSFVEEGTIEGFINHAPVGDGGFGYDPVFYVPEFDKTTAQLTEQEKNSISHRFKALKKIKDRLWN